MPTPLAAVERGVPVPVATTMPFTALDLDGPLVRGTVVAAGCARPDSLTLVRHAGSASIDEVHVACLAWRSRCRTSRAARNVSRASSGASDRSRSTATAARADLPLIRSARE
jgi:hypothetical protein